MGDAWIAPAAGAAGPVVERVRTGRRRVAALLGACALLVAGCGNADDGDDTAGAATAGTEGSAGTGGSEGGGGGGEVVPLDVPGVTDDEIRFAAFGTDSNNPLGTCNLACMVDGIEAYFAFRNSEGGVHGRDLVLATVLDDELTNNQQRAIEILSANDTFGAFSAAQIPTGWAELAAEGVPLYVWAIHFADMAGKPSIFGNAGVRCTTCSSRPPMYAAAELLGGTTVGSLGYGVSQASKDCAGSNRASVERYGADTGLAMGYFNDDLDFGLPNGIGPEVSAMKDAGVDVVLACIDLNGMKTLAQELERQGMGDVPMIHANTYDAAFVEEAGGLFEGDIVSVQFRPFEAGAEGGLADFLEWMASTGSAISEPAMVGWINADLAYQGLVAAGPTFDRASVVEATNQLTDFTAGGLVQPIDWSRQHDAPTEDDPATHGGALDCSAFVRVTGGRFELVGDPAAPFFCWDGTTRDWAEPEPMGFE